MSLVCNLFVSASRKELRGRLRERSSLALTQTVCKKLWEDVGEGLPPR
jgi:hypothetical protein